MIASPREGRRVPDLVLEQYRLGELPPEAAARVERLLGAEPEIRQRLDALARSDVEIRARYPAEALAASVRARVAERGVPFAQGAPSHVRWMMPTALAIAATMLILAIPPAVKRLQLSTSGGLQPGVEERIKGSGASLAVYRRTAEGSETLADGDVAHPGDLIRLGYRAAGRGYGVILSIDGRGGVTLHFPLDGGMAAPLDKNGTVLLDRAYELDDAPGWERFYLVTSDASFSTLGVIDTAKRAAAAGRPSPPAVLAVPRGLEQTAFTLQKERRP
jgi:hypothetical protein